MSEAIAKAIEREDSEFKRTHWASSYSSSNHDSNWLEQQRGNKLVYTRRLTIQRSAEDAFYVIQQIGGKKAGTTQTLFGKFVALLIRLWVV